MAALASLRAVSNASEKNRDEVATGLRISHASHNAAYWSISTTMKSDIKALSAVSDALGSGAAQVDIAYYGMTQVVETVKEIQAKVVAAAGNPENAAKIHTEISALAAQARSIAASASFAGSNMLSTAIPDLFSATEADRTKSMLATFVRDAQGGVSLGSIKIDLAQTALFNADGGGILEGDPRSPKTIGGMRIADGTTGEMSTSNNSAGSRAMQVLTFTGPVDLSGGLSIAFDVTVDKDQSGLPGPHHPGATSAVTITAATVNSVVPGANGIISNYQQMAAVLQAALSGTGATATLLTDGNGRLMANRFGIMTQETSGLNGSSVGISGLSGIVGGLRNFETHGGRGNRIDLSFSAFKVHEDVEIDFRFMLNSSTRSVTIDRSLVDSVLGTSDGMVKSEADMAALLGATINQPGLVITAQAGSVRLETDPSVRVSGSKSVIGFAGISVNVEPIISLGLDDLDVRNADMIPAYMSAVNDMLAKVIDGAATLGAVRKRLDIQAAFTASLADSLTRGVGYLVDADMDRTSARLQALQVQQQLATRSLSIANAAPQSILQLIGR